MYNNVIFYMFCCCMEQVVILRVLPAEVSVHKLKWFKNVNKCVWTVCVRTLYAVTLCCTILRAAQHITFARVTTTATHGKRSYLWYLGITRTMQFLMVYFAMFIIWAHDYSTSSTQQKETARREKSSGKMQRIKLKLPEISCAVRSFESPRWDMMYDRWMDG